LRDRRRRDAGRRDPRAYAGHLDEVTTFHRVLSPLT
jgi:hypothetical protein